VRSSRKGTRQLSLSGAGYTLPVTEPIFASRLEELDVGEHQGICYKLGGSGDPGTACVGDCRVDALLLLGAAHHLTTGITMAGSCFSQCT
jgi:hypothetical protein